jgi:hypothetical protein
MFRSSVFSEQFEYLKARMDSRIPVEIPGCHHLNGADSHQYNWFVDPDEEYVDESIVVISLADAKIRANVDCGGFEPSTPTLSK